VVLIIDEITAGFRLAAGGAHLVLGVVPDIAVFAKGMSNGYPMAAIVGTAKYMNVAQETFVSSTYWTERVGPAAALATIKKHIRLDLAKLLAEKGARVREIWTRAAAKAGITIQISGMSPLPGFAFDHSEAIALKTLFNQKLLDRGYLASTLVYVTYAHTAALLDQYESAVSAVLAEIADLVKSGADVKTALRGPLVHIGFSRLA
jgi:glutamate-1-semialdehyde 2,1-aminomutase